MLAYESRLKYILDEEAKLKDVKYMAEQKERKAEKDEMVRNLLAKKMDFISGVTRLSVERIKELAPM